MMGKEHQEVRNRTYPTWGNNLTLNQRGEIAIPSSYKRTKVPIPPKSAAPYSQYSNKIYGHSPRRSGTRYMGATLRGGEFIMVTNEYDTETGKRQLSGSQSARPAAYWDKTPPRSRTQSSSRVIQKEYDRQRISSSNPFRRVDEKYSSGLMTRSAMMKQRKDEGKNAMLGYDLDGDGYVDNNEVVISKRLDKDGNGFLDKAERVRALKDPNLLSNLSFGHDKNLTNEYRTIQIEGQVVNTHDWSKGPNGSEVVDKYVNKMQNSTSSRREHSAPAMSRTQRMNQELWERQKKTPGFQYVQEPKFRTRSDLKRAQKRALLCERANNAFDGSRGTNAGLLSKKINNIRSLHARF